MKHLLLSAALAATITAGAAVPMPRNGVQQTVPNLMPTENINLLPLPEETRGYKDFTYTNLKLSVMECWHVGDLLGDGTAFYYILLSDTSFDENANITAPGHLFRILINADAPEDVNNFTVPCGEFTASDNYDGIGTFDTNRSELFDAFYHPTDPEANPGLYGYSFYVTDGILAIGENADGTYSAGIEVTVTHYSGGSADGVFDASGVYIGDVKCVDYHKSEDPLNYNPIEGEYHLDTSLMNGKYQDGYWELCLYSEGLLDKDGFVTNSGDLFVMNLKVWKLSGFARYDKLPGTYTMTSFDGPTFPAWHFIEGRYYDIYGGNYFVVGTGLTVYGLRDGNLYHDYVGLANGGKIVVKEVDDGLFRIEIDVTTPQGARMFGTWEGYLADYITDFGDNASESAHEDDSAVNQLSNPSAGYTLQDRVLCCSTPASVYSMTGALVAKGTSLNLTLLPGIYILETEGKATRLLVK